MFFRILQHLLPDAIAWRIRQATSPWQWDGAHQWDEEGLTWGELAGGRWIDRFFAGLAAPFQSLREFIDLAYLDYFASTTRDLGELEYQHGLYLPASEEDRRTRLSAARKATGGQSPGYLQGVVQAAGFNLYVHEWWAPGDDITDPPRNPRDYTNDPTIGRVQCGESQAQCGEPSALANGFLANEVGYLVNSNLTLAAPPPVPNDAAQWPYFLYWGAETFPDAAVVPTARRRELERLLLQLCPSRCWIVLLVDFVDAPAEGWPVTWNGQPVTWNGQSVTWDPS